MKLLHSNSFQDYYHFKINNVIVLQHFKGESITVSDDNKLSPNGKFEIESQFKTDILDGGKKAYIQSIKSGKYIKIEGDNVVLGGMHLRFYYAFSHFFVYFVYFIYRKKNR